MNRVDNSAAFDTTRRVIHDDSSSCADSEFRPTLKKCRRFIDDAVIVHRRQYDAECGTFSRVAHRAVAFAAQPATPATRIETIKRR